MTDKAIEAVTRVIIAYTLFNCENRKAVIHGDLREMYSDKELLDARRTAEAVIEAYEESLWSVAEEYPEGYRNAEEVYQVHRAELSCQTNKGRYKRPLPTPPKE